MIRLHNKVVLITGGSRGIGAATVRMFADAGARVAFTYSTQRDAAHKVAEEVSRKGRQALMLKVNIARRAEVQKAVREIKKHFGRIDVLVNNAGIWKRAPIDTMTEQQLAETLNINLKSAFYFCGAVVPLMKKQKYGRIINITSTAGQRGEPFYSHYAATKAGIIGLTKSLAAELGQYNINVNAVAPGLVDTDMTAAALGRRSTRNEIERIIPRGKVATPEDIAGAIVFLASHLADHIVGATINVNGGSVLV
ncbi:MAG: 3-oxoacyl-ACP reductase FabG [Ignavibacteriae bacterium]|nr:3-oxoacyl-ACP reductase FabG [Ignavibacteriota bacterium]